MSVAAKHAHIVSLDQHLAAIAVMLDFVNPVFALGGFINEASWGSMNLSRGLRDMVTWKRSGGPYHSLAVQKRKAPMLGLPKNYGPVGVPPCRVWPSCSSARSSTFLIAASFSESLIFRGSRRRIILPQRNMAPSMIAEAAMR